MRNAIARALTRRLADIVRVDNPWAVYENRPVDCALECFGLKLWSRQVEMVEATLLSRFVTVVSANGVGKTQCAAFVALFTLLTAPPGNLVILTAAKMGHLQEALYAAVQKLWRSSTLPIDGSLGQLAETGIRLENGSRLFGAVAEHVEGFQGIRSAAGTLIVADECSGIEPNAWEAIIANLSDTARLLLIGNGLCYKGYFFDSHHRPELGFRRLRITLEEAIEAGIDALHGPKFRDNIEKVYGRNSLEYRVKVLAEWATLGARMLFTPGDIGAAIAANATAPRVGPATIACDPAGQGEDMSAFVIRIGGCMVRGHVRHGLTPEGIREELLGLVEWARPQSDGRPRVIIDADGSIGAAVRDVMWAWKREHDTFDFFPLRGSDKSTRPREVARLRDELWLNLADYIKSGGGIISD